MPRFGLMRRTGQGKLRIGNAIRLGRTRFDNREGLNRLHCRSREHQRFVIAPMPQEVSPGIGNDDMHLMPAFDDRTSPDCNVKRCRPGGQSNRPA